MATPSTTPTTNGVPSTSFQDLLFNSELLDILLNSSDEQVSNRLGISIDTWKGLRAKVDTILADGTGAVARAEAAAAIAEAAAEDASAIAVGDPSGLVVTDDIEGETKSLGDWSARIGRTLRIAVVGDSISHQTFGRSDAWPKLLREYLEEPQIKCDVRSFAVGGAALSGLFNAQRGGRSQGALAAEFKPDIIIIALGFNDIFTQSQSLEDVKASLDAAISYFKSETTADIFVRKQYVYDRSAITPDASLTEALNANVIPNLHTYITNRNAFSWVMPNEEYLSKPINSTRLDKLKISYDFFAYIDSVAASDARVFGNMEMDLFRVCRLGWHIDGLHPMKPAHLYFAAEAYKAIAAKSAELGDPLALNRTGFDSDDLMDPTEMWLDTVDFTNAGTSAMRYTLKPGAIAYWSTYHGIPIAKYFRNWMFKFHREITWSIQQSAQTADSPIAFKIGGLPQGTSNNVGVLRVNGTYSTANLEPTAINSQDDLVYVASPQDISTGYAFSAQETFTAGITIQSGNWPGAEVYGFEADVTLLT